MNLASRATPRRLIVLAGAAVALVWAIAVGEAQTTAPEAREVPARMLPVPDTVSPEMQQLLAAPIPGNWDSPPSTSEEWEAFAAQADQNPRDPQPVLDRFDISYEPTVVNGIPSFMLTPSVIPPENRDRLLVHLHGGCYMMGGGVAAMYEGALLAGFGRFRVLSVDYRRPPAFPYPAALDDAVSAWQGALDIADPEKMGIFGASAGGALTLSTVLRLKQEGLPLPAAIAPGTPMSDLTMRSDSFYTNRLVDNVLMGTDARCQAMAEVYADGHDLADPLLSPVRP